MATITKEREVATTIIKERELATTTNTTKERVSTLEERYKHLATKADLNAIETRLMKWLFGMMLGVIALATTIVSAVARLLN